MNQNQDPDVLANAIGRLLGCGAISIFIVGLAVGFLAGWSIK